MDDQHAEQIMRTARQLDTETVERCGASVHVSFLGFDREYSEIGRASVTVTVNGVSVSELEHTQCSSGLAWSRELAGQLGRLERASHWRPPASDSDDAGPSPHRVWLN